jgi:hypothetical protein
MSRRAARAYTHQQNIFETIFREIESDSTHHVFLVETVPTSAAAARHVEDVFCVAVPAAAPGPPGHLPQHEAKAVHVGLQESVERVGVESLVEDLGGHVADRTHARVVRANVDLVLLTGRRKYIFRKVSRQLFEFCRDSHFSEVCSQLKKRAKMKYSWRTDSGLSGTARWSGRSGQNKSGLNCKRCPAKG